MGRAGRPRHPDVLTPREWEVLALLRAGLSNDQIAQHLGISFDGAKYHVSEIITKLGVRDRHEAAAWRPEASDAPARWLFAPLVALRRVRLSSFATPFGVATIAVTIVAVGALAWGVTATRGNRPPERRSIAAERPCERPTPNVEPPKVVGLVNVASGTCTVLPIEDRVMLAQWVDAGKTLVAYEIDKQRFELFDLSGRELQPIYYPVSTKPDAAIHATISVSPDAKSLLIERDVRHTLTMSDVSTGQERDLPLLEGINTQASFSPDGHHILYVNINGGRRSLVIAGADATAATVLRSVDDNTDYLTPLQWSPDGTYLLILSGQQGTPCGPNCNNIGTWASEVIDTAGSSIWKSVKMHATDNDYRVTSIQWAGAGRLLISQPEVSAKDGSVLPDAARFVAIPQGAEIPADPKLARASTVSPDGNHVAVGCDLLDLTRLVSVPVSGCRAVTDWSADGTLGLISFKGN